MALSGDSELNVSDDLNFSQKESDAQEQEMHSEQDEVAREGFSLWKKLRSPRTWVSFIIAIAIIIFAFRGLDISPQQIWDHMKGANKSLLLVGFGVFYLTFPLRAVRWNMLLKNAHVPMESGRKSWSSFPALIEYIYLSWFANCIVPAKLGDAYRSYLIKQNAQGNVSFSTALGTIFAERLLDMLALFALLVVSGWFTFGAKLPGETRIVFAFGALLVVVILVILASMRWLSPYIHKFLGSHEFLTSRSVHEFYGRFEQAALRSFRPSILPNLIVLTAGVWLLEGFRLFFVIQALGQEGLHLALPSIIFVALASSLLTALPLTPAGLGVLEGTVTAVLIKFFLVPQDLAAAVTFLDRLINFWSIILFGFIVYLLSKRK